MLQTVVCKAWAYNDANIIRKSRKEFGSTFHQAVGSLDQVARTQPEFITYAVKIFVRDAQDAQ